jgi:hypothetical protein
MCRKAIIVELLEDILRSCKIFGSASHMWLFGKVKNMIPDACIVHRSNEFLLPILLLQATVTTTDGLSSTYLQIWIQTTCNQKVLAEVQN